MVMNMNWLRASLSLTHPTHVVSTHSWKPELVRQPLPFGEKAWMVANAFSGAAIFSFMTIVGLYDPFGSVRDSLRMSD